MKDEFTKEDSKELAIWLAEAFPKKYRMAGYSIVIDTRTADNPTEYCIILHDDKHKKLYVVPEMHLRHIVADIDSMKKQGMKEFEPVRKLGIVIEESESTYCYLGGKDEK